MSLSQTIRVLDKIFTGFDNVKNWFKKKWRAWRTRSVRRAVNGDDVNAVAKWLRLIKKKRRDRRDAA